MPRYVRMLEAAGADWDAVARTLEAGAHELHELARLLLERWLLLVEEAAVSRQRPALMSAYPAGQLGG